MENNIPRHIEETDFFKENNNIIANRLDSNREFSDLLTGSLVGSINVSDNN